MGEEYRTIRMKHALDVMLYLERIVQASCLRVPPKWYSDRTFQLSKVDLGGREWRMLQAV
jgi:hypothetical protein